MTFEQRWENVKGQCDTVQDTLEKAYEKANNDIKQLLTDGKITKEEASYPSLEANFVNNLALARKMAKSVCKQWITFKKPPSVVKKEQTKLPVVVCLTANWLSSTCKRTAL